MAQFALTITLGNAAMLTGEDVAAALRDVADRQDTPHEYSTGERGTIRDLNGNRVGEWEVTA